MESGGYIIKIILSMLLELVIDLDLNIYFVFCIILTFSAHVYYELTTWYIFSVG